MGRCQVLALFYRCSKTERCLFLRCASRPLSSVADNEAGKAATVRQQLETSAREDRLDFFTAAKILFSSPAKPRKFGLDFHLWQFFMACLPPFAVYLTAQYARSEMRRMEKERDLPKEALRTVAAEELASIEASSGVEQSGKANQGTGNPEMAPEHTGQSRVKNKDGIAVILPENEILAMRARLDAMEDKVRLLESVLPETKTIPSVRSETAVPKDSQENVQKSPADNVVEGNGDKRRPHRESTTSVLDMQKPTDLHVPQESKQRSRSKPEEREVSH